MHYCWINDSDIGVPNEEIICKGSPIVPLLISSLKIVNAGVKNIHIASIINKFLDLASWKIVKKKMLFSYQQNIEIDKY